MARVKQVSTQPELQKVVIVLAVHGEPPRDFPREEFATFFGLQARLEFAGVKSDGLARRFAKLDAKLRKWPRNVENDPFYAGSQKIAKQLSKVTGCKVIVGFNEFCAPSLDEALDQAAAHAPEKVFVVTPMMTPGGGHSEAEIPTAVKRAQQRHPGVAIRYVWPFDLSDIAKFLARQIDQAARENK